MPLKLLDATISTFDSVFEKFRAEAPKNKVNLILFLADKDPSTSLSWCPGTQLITYGGLLVKLFHTIQISFFLSGDSSILVLYVQIIVIYSPFFYNTDFGCAFEIIEKC